MLTPAERGLLVFGGRLITLEQAVRFMTDYLEGDRYYHDTRGQQNLRRARAQLQLFRSLTEHEKGPGEDHLGDLGLRRPHPRHQPQQADPADQEEPQPDHRVDRAPVEQAPHPEQRRVDEGATTSTQLSIAIGRLSGDDVTPASRRMSAHPGPAGFTSFTKLTSVARSAGGAISVTLTQTTVVVATVAMSAMCEGMCAPSSRRRRTRRRPGTS